MIRAAALRLFRLAAIGLAAWLVHVADQRPDQTGEIALAEARVFFPDAQRLSPPDDRAACAVWSGGGERLGTVLKTSPQTDDLIGYSGPSNLLAAIDVDGRVVGVKLLTSGDTPAHVSDVRRHDAFWRRFIGWTPSSEPLPKIDGVGGSTLTSLAMVEAVEQRLTGHNDSRRFPQPVTLPEVRGFFPKAAELRPPDTKSYPTWPRVVDESGVLLGFAVRTAPSSDNVRGYRGPTESLVALAPDGRTIVGVRLRSSFDTPEYVDRVRDDADFLALLAAQQIDNWPTIDFRRAGIEGVSGATQTSFAVAEGLRHRFAADAAFRAKEPMSWIARRDLGLLAIAIGGLVMSLSSLRTSRRLRTMWHIIVVVVLGVWLGDLLSLALFAGWARHGAPLATAPGIVALAAVALLTPWGTQRNVYCQHICPHGIVQGWLSRFRRWHVAVPVRWRHWLNRAPAALLLCSIIVAVSVPSFDLSTIEPFDAWVLRGSAIASASVAVIGLIASLFVPQAYCRFGCPTGALLKFIRSGGRYDHFGVRDAVAAVLLVGLGVGVWLPRLSLPSPQKTASQSSPPQVLRGEAFGTTWSVKLRGQVANLSAIRERVAAELERIESTLSHWRPGSATSEFNASETTLEIEQPRELVQLVARAQELSRVTNGVFDITVAPLVNAWGFGPAGDLKHLPTDAELAVLLEKVGWQKLIADVEAGTLQKRHPELQIDLGSLLQGYTADRIADVVVDASGNESIEFLIEVGGELLARGSWTVAIEDPSNPTRPLRTLILTNAALATSGTSRSSRRVGHETVHHFISPKTGRPVAATVSLCSVRATTCTDADGWATALWLTGLPDATRIASEQGLTAWLLDQHGQLQTNQFADKSSK